MMRRVFGILFLLMMGTGIAAGELSQGVNLSNMDGWNIVVDEKAIASEVYAAEEFQSSFEDASGVKLLIVKEAKGSECHIYIGTGEAMRAAPIGFSIDEFGKEDS